MTGPPGPEQHTAPGGLRGGRPGAAHRYEQHAAATCEAEDTGPGGYGARRWPVELVRAVGAERAPAVVAAVVGVLDAAPGRWLRADDLIVAELRAALAAAQPRRADSGGPF